MKKLTLGFLIILFALLPMNHEQSYGANNTREKDTLRILTSFYPIYITTLNITKNVPGVAVTNLTPPLTGCLHDYSLTTKDIKKFVGADIFVANGAGMESFLDRIIKQYPAVKVVQLSKGIPLIKGDGAEGDNPHVWVSIFNAIIQVKNLGNALQEIDPAHKNLYQKNTAEYVLQLETLRRKMHAALKPYQGKKIVTFHEAFPYFAQEFKLEIAAVVEREPGSQPNARELAKTIELIKRSKIKALFVEPQYPALSAQTIARETGAKVYILDPVVTGPEQPDAYLRIMEKNLATLEKALKN
ncbi:MAG: metal ABC transporter substrate-binding protein [Candidatus Omnitrophica bacterium]|nr:metal ABC transporter substrate-binding protein [Candidatus Omnitrophota bacterium]